jgi:outer membrane protein OmpA-like peptidoglycan-associated protein
MLRRLGTAVLWAVIVAVGYAGSVLYTATRKDQTPIVARVQLYETMWQAALADVRTTPPPALDAFVKKAPVWQHNRLRQALKPIEEKHQGEYAKQADRLVGDLQNEFKELWDKALADFADPPDVAQYLEKYNPAFRERYHLPKLIAELNDAQQKRHPRTRMALDDFSGYCVFRTAEFRKRLTEKDFQLHLVEDQGVYTERMRGLRDGTTPLAVFTIDALLNTTAGDPDPPVIVMVIDESCGADAMIVHRDVLPDLDALNRPDLRIVLMPDSPSETLARVVRSRFGQPKRMPKNCFLPVERQQEIVDRFRESGKEPTAFVLWEPFVSQLLRDHPDDARVLTDSEKLRGYIVDVLVANRRYLKDHRAEVRNTIKAYLEAARAIQTAPEGMAAVLRTDLPKPIAPEMAPRVARSILWKSTQDNYAHFGLTKSPSGAALPLEELIANIHAALKQTGAVSTVIRPEEFFDRSLLEELHAEGFDAGGGFSPPPPATVANDWDQLRPLGTLQMEPIAFHRGQAVIPDRSKPELQELANTLKTMPQYFLEVRGHAKGDTEADAALALERANAVAHWLHEQGGVAPTRIRAKAATAPTEKVSAVTLRILEKPAMK